MAALYVVLHHAWLQTWPTIIYGNPPHGLTAVFTGWLLFGHFAVTVFITLSGFCLMLPVARTGGILRGGTGTFLKRRARRILPPYYAALALSLLIACLFLKVHTHTLYDASLPVTWPGVWEHVFLFHNLTAASPQINGPLWSVAVECQIYLFFPLLIWITARYGIFAALLSTCFGSLFLYAASLHSPTLSQTPYYFLFIFVMGMFAAYAVFRPCIAMRPAKNRIVFAVASTLFGAVIAAVGHRFFPDAHLETFALGAAMVAALFCLWGSAPRNFAILGAISFGLWLGLAALYRMQHLVITDLLIGLATACTLVVLTQTPSGLLYELFSARWATWLGTFSYSLYLIHFPLQQLFWQWAVAPFPKLSGVVGFSIVAVIGTAIIVPAAYAFYWFFERPFVSGSTAGKKM